MQNNKYDSLKHIRYRIRMVLVTDNETNIVINNDTLYNYFVLGLYDVNGEQVTDDYKGLILGDMIVFIVNESIQIDSKLWWNGTTTYTRKDTPTSGGGTAKRAVIIEDLSSVS